MSGETFVFKDPPADGRRGKVPDALAFFDAIKARPGEWAIYTVASTASVGTQLRDKAARIGLTIEVTTRRDKKTGKTTIWGRVVGVTAYDEAVDKCVEMFDRFHHAIRETNRRAEKLAAAEVEFLNAVDEQRGAYEEAMAAFTAMRDAEPRFPVIRATEEDVMWPDSVLHAKELP